VALVLLIIAGWALIHSSPLTGIYLVFAAGVFHWRVIGYEEVVLAEQFPSQWTQYVKNIPRWVFKPQNSK
jgi:protein-S-isoprenylcysteine O-methyltransferase Ste14